MSRRRSSPGEPATGSAPDVSSRDPIERFAFLLGPADGSAVFAAADDSWRLPPQGENRTIVWGRSPLPSGSAVLAAVLRLLPRERALATARLSRGGTVHRLLPQTLSGGRVRNSLRATLLGGAVVELPAERSGPRLIDVVAEAAGVDDPLEALHLSSGGAILARVRAHDRDALLRVGVAGVPGDPARGAAALAHLAATSLPVPGLIATGGSSGASWALETLLPGRRPAGTTSGLLREVAALCDAFPAGNGPPAAPRRDLEALGVLLPDRADPLSALAHGLRGELRTLPSVMRHGDLWIGNLLAEGNRLSGVVDWDAWDPGAVPGADLLHLHATNRRIAERRELGEIWMRRPWKDDAYRSLLAGPSATVPDDVRAIAWWAAEVRGTVSRHPARARDERWLAINVDAVLRALRP